MAETDQNSGKIAVRLVTPDRVLVECTAEAVELPSSSGYMEVLYGHAPLLSELGAGMVTLHGASCGDDRYFVASGFVEVLPNQVTILAETAMHPEEIDAEAARAQLAAGEAEWREAGDEAAKYDAANAVIHEAEAKLAAAGTTGEKH
jgi:F-type H+-transporting ATPase subunit epsilon